MQRPHTEQTTADEPPHRTTRVVTLERREIYVKSYKFLIRAENALPLGKQSCSNQYNSTGTIIVKDTPGLCPLRVRN